MSKNQNIIQAPPSRSNPPAPDAQASLLTAIFANRIGKAGQREILVGEPPGARECAVLSVRLREVNSALEHRDRPLVERALAALFSVTKLSADDRRNPAALISDYALFLGDLPAWAVAEACFRLGRGEGESSTFAPAAPEIHRFAERIIAPHIAETAKISRVLRSADGTNRTEPSAEERQRVARGFAKLSESLVVETKIKLRQPVATAGKPRQTK